MDGSNFEHTPSTGVAADELRAFVERIERINSEIADLKEASKEVFAEIKSRGYMTRPIRTIIKERKERATNPDKIAEEKAVLEMYKSALGMD